MGMYLHCMIFHVILQGIRPLKSLVISSVRTHHSTLEVFSASCHNVSKTTKKPLLLEVLPAAAAALDLNECLVKLSPTSLLEEIGPCK
jgi:hypothetical protein